MDAIFQQVLNDPLGSLVLRLTAGEGLMRAGLFLLVAARLAGLFGIGMLLGRTLLTWQVRVGLIVLLTLVIAPALPLATETANPVKMVHHETRSRAESIKAGMASIGDVLASPIDFSVAMLCEIAIGAVMGLGVAVVLSGLRLGGEWIDRHSGLGFGSVFNPEFLSEGSAPAELMLLFGIASILLMEPTGGHILFVSTLLETFRSLPIGTSHLSPSLLELPASLMQQSIVLGLRVAMPMVVVMSLIDMTIGFASRSSRWSVLPMTYAVRTAAALLILAACWPGIADAVAMSVLDSLRLSAEGLSS